MLRANQVISFEGSEQTIKVYQADHHRLCSTFMSYSEFSYGLTHMKTFGWLKTTVQLVKLIDIKIGIKAAIYSPDQNYHKHNSFQFSTKSSIMIPVNKIKWSVSWKNRIWRLGPEVIKLFSFSTQLSMKFILLIDIKYGTNASTFFLLNKAEHGLHMASVEPTSSIVEELMAPIILTLKAPITTGRRHVIHIFQRK